MAKTLLEKAREIKEVIRGPKPNISEEEIELGIAWLKDEITLRQVATVLGYKYQNQAIFRMSYLFREAYRQGILYIASEIGAQENATNSIATDKRPSSKRIEGSS